MALKTLWATEAGARKFDISVKTLANWSRPAQDGGSVKGGKRRPVSDPEADGSRLRAENRRSIACPPAAQRGLENGPRPFRRI